jgi:hypothetical protein
MFVLIAQCIDAFSTKTIPFDIAKERCPESMCNYGFGRCCL